MANRLPLPSQANKPVVLDRVTTRILVYSMDSNFDGIIKNDREYYRAIFYLKLRGMQNEIKKSDALSNKKQRDPEYSDCNDFLFNKHNSTLLFECLYHDSQSLIEILESGNSQRITEIMEDKDKNKQLSFAYCMLNNDKLYDKYKDRKTVTNDNFALTRMKASLDSLKEYLDSDGFKETLAHIRYNRKMEKSNDFIVGNRVSLITERRTSTPKRCEY